MANSGKILVIKPSSLGDIVHLFPALELLKREFPGKELDFAVHPAFAGILDLSPFPVRKKIIFDRKKLSSPATFFSSSRSLLRELRYEEYDLVIDFQGLFRSGFLSGISRSCITAGFTHPREKSAALFYNRKIDVEMEQHAVSRYAELVNKLCDPKFPVPEVKLPIQTRGLPKLPEHFMVIVPCARWESKTFPPRLFADIATEALKHAPGTGVVIAGGKGDSLAAAEIMKFLPDAVDLTGKTSLVQLVSVTALSDSVLTNDSGPMHIAALANTRVFALFGPTLPELTGPYGTEHLIFKNEGLPCSGCMKRFCPKGKEQPCHDIDVRKAGSALGNHIVQKILEV